MSDRVNREQVPTASDQRQPARQSTLRSRLLSFTPAARVPAASAPTLPTLACLALTLATCLSAGHSLAQCQPAWLPGAGPADINGPISSMSILPNGDLVAGGSFTRANSTQVNHVARWDGAGWSALGAGTSFDVKSVAAAPNGDIFALSTAPQPVIARWDGSTWTQLPDIPNGQFVSARAAAALNVTPAGDLYAVGMYWDYSQIIPATYGYADRWNGSAWNNAGQSLFVPGASCYYPSDPQIPPTCVPQGSINTIAVLPNGNLVVGGDFSFTCCPNAGVAQWDGAAWTPLGNPNLGVVFSLAVAPNGDVIAGGNAGSHIARWNGATWTSLGAGLDGIPSALAALPGGTVIAGGSFASAGGTPASNIAIWYHNSWYPLGAGVDGPVSALAVSSNILNVGGSFTNAGGSYSRYFARRSILTPDLVGPDSAVACVGSTPTFSVAWSGQEDCTYAWRLNGQFINPAENPSAAASTLELFASPGDAGTFDCVVTNACGSVTSRPATLTILDPSDPSCSGTACNIDVSDPVSVVACAGDAPVFHVDVNGQGPFTYAWRLNEERINFAQNPSAATDTLALFVQPGDAGSFDCIVTNACHSVTSTIATLTVRDPSDPACNPPSCNPDVNNDGATDQGDVEYLINAIAGGGNPTNIDPDFNHDGVSDQTDVDALINVIAGGQCP